MEVANRTHHRQTTRWSIDYSLKKSSVTIQAKTETYDDIQNKLVTSLSASAVLQPTVAVDEKFALELALQDVTVTEAPQNIVVIEPFSVGLTLDAPLSPLRFPKSSSFPRLRFDGPSTWTVTLQPNRWAKDSPESFDGIKHEIDAFSIISQVKVRFTPSTIALVTDLGKHLARSKKRFQLAKLATG